MAKRKVLIFGSSGMLGTDLCAVFDELSAWETITSLESGCDITDPEAIATLTLAHHPAVVVNCAAYTNVDGAESAKDLAMAVNGRAPGHIARAASQAGAKMVQISTEYVFDGTQSEAYREEDEPCPVNAYGASKLAGEQAVQKAAPDALVLRTSWLYGKHGRNFVHTILELAQQHDQIDMVNDQFGTPTWTLDVARAIPALLDAGVEGLVHVVNAGSCSWYELAQKVLELTDLSLKLSPISSEQLHRAAVRPKNSRLDTGRLTALLGSGLQPWEDALAQYLASCGPASDTADLHSGAGLRWGREQ